jgi:hypothetical protein
VERTVTYLAIKYWYEIWNFRKLNKKSRIQNFHEKLNSQIQKNLHDKKKEITIFRGTPRAAAAI